MIRQRGNLLFPFAGARAHAYTLNRQVLDGDTAFRIAEDDSANLGGDVRELRMQSLSHPLAALRAAMAADASLSNVHVEDTVSVVDVRLAGGEEYSIGFEWKTGLPAFVAWSGPNHLLGEVRYTTQFTGYVPYSGIKLPLGMVTYMDWRDIEFFKIYGEGYIVNGEIPDLAAPRSLSETQPGGRNSGPLQAENITGGLWRLSNGTVVIEFADHLTLFELGGFGYDDETLPQINLARSLVPGKPVTEYIASHQHDDHASGLRTAVAEGLTVITHRNNEEIFREIASRPAPNFPDMLHRNPRPISIIEVGDRMRLQDEERTVDLYHVVAHNHMAGALMAYLPDENILIEADLTPSRELQWWADAYEQNIKLYDLHPEIIVSVHFGRMSHTEMLEFLAPGRIGGQERCVAQAELDHFVAGCPPFYPEGNLIPGMIEFFDPPFE